MDANKRESSMFRAYSRPFAVTRIPIGFLASSEVFRSETSSRKQLIVRYSNDKILLFMKLAGYALSLSE